VNTLHIMKKNSRSLKVGDSVKVKGGMQCPDLADLCIGGWQGRVSELGEDWSWLGEEGKRIQKVLAGVDEDDDTKALEAWQSYLEKALTFPFYAAVSEYREGGPLKYGDKVRVKKIAMLDDDYGLFVELRHGHKRYLFPLGDLEVTNKDSANYLPLNDYCTWFANS
jgi:hypothetical protein